MRYGAVDSHTGGYKERFPGKKSKSGSIGGILPVEPEEAGGADPGDHIRHGKG